MIWEALEYNIVCNVHVLFYLGKKGKTKWKPVPLGEVCGTGLPRKNTNWVDQVDSDLNGGNILFL